MRRRKRAEPEARPNLTPMLDVVFIMLIFFIVTATFVTEVGIETNPPQPNQSPPPDASENILASIGQHDDIYINGRSVDVRHVRANLERLYAQQREASLVIAAHPLSSTESLVGVMDAARMVGIEGVQLAER